MGRDLSPRGFAGRPGRRRDGANMVRQVADGLVWNQRPQAQRLRGV